MNASQSISFGFDEATKARGRSEASIKTDNANYTLAQILRKLLPQCSFRERWKRRHAGGWWFGLHCDERH